jgi:predicted RNA binding protein YcfA (HicA-like mRNA interferase family)
VVKLPVVSGAELVTLLKKAGFKVIRTKGSHVSLQKGNFRTVVPLHDELAKGDLAKLM